MKKWSQSSNKIPHLCWLLPSLRRMLLPLLRFICDVSSPSLRGRGIMLGIFVQKCERQLPMDKRRSTSFAIMIASLDPVSLEW